MDHRARLESGSLETRPLPHRCRTRRGHWWPPGHIIGYEHTFVHTIADFVNAVVDKRSVQPTFEDGLRNQVVLEAVEKSAKTRKWIKL